MNTHLVRGCAVAILYGALWSSSAWARMVQADATVDLGTVHRVETLLSYPNCIPTETASCPTPPYPQTVEATLSHYLDQSLERDGLTRPGAMPSSFSISRQNDHLFVTFHGEAAKDYPAALTNFLDDGDKAWAATQSIQQRSPDPWKASWRFFLPWGLAMTRNPTVELLHFPPDYSLTGQDYLNAKTTERWAGLLEVNGVDHDETPAYQAIVDIAPIAAPAEDGTPITNANVYGAYYPYAGALLGSWARTSSGQGKPMVAFGAPVREWVKSYLNLSLAVDQAGMAVLPNGLTVPVIGSNHPSMIFYAAFNDKDHSENFAGGMRVMRQDLIAACWQAKMGKDPTQNAQAVQSSCDTSWTQNTYGICMQLETTIYKKTQDQAQAVCGASGLLGQPEKVKE